MKSDFSGFPTEIRELLSSLDGERQKEALERIEGGEPPAYVFGRKFFFNNYFYINRDCLIPRPDTERAVEAVIENLPRGGSLADLCSGCGVIALSVLDIRRDALAFLCDISENALEAAKKNTENLGLSDRVSIKRSDILKEDPLEGEYDIIVSNPPYLRTDEIGEYPDLAAEPIIAFDGGVDGLDFYRRIVRDLSAHLKKDGTLIFEIGYTEKPGIERIARKQGFSCETRRDYGGNWRTAILKRSNREEDTDEKT